MKVFRYTLPFTQDIKLGTQYFRERSGILLEQDGEWSEAAPLPNFSRETITTVVSALRGTEPKPASLEFALESLRRPLTTGELPLNALLQGEPDAMLEQAAGLSESACRAVKVKVGRRSVDEEIELVTKIRERLRDGQALRLDANRAWDWSTAILFAKEVKSAGIEYIEEPLQDYLRLEEYAAETDQNYALDETLAQHHSLDTFPSASAYVIKPTILGGRLPEIVHQRKPLTFSSCYETGVGLTRIAQLALEWAPHVPAGLDTYRYLAEDVLSHRLVVRDWKLRIAESWMVDDRQLQEIVL